MQSLVVSLLVEEGPFTPFSLSTGPMLGALYSAFVASLPAPSPAGGRLNDEGEALFAATGCAACHTVLKTESAVGPSLRDVGKRKAFMKGLTQLAEEGVVQVFRPQDGSPALVGVVGPLQLDVLRQRLKDEYGLEVMWDGAEFALARWISAEDPKVLEKFVKELLPVVDSLEKALESMQGDASEAHREGVSMTLKMQLDVLSKFGVESIEPNTPPLVIEKVPPVISSMESLPSLPREASRPISDSI